MSENETETAPPVDPPLAALPPPSGRKVALVLIGLTLAFTAICGSCTYGYIVYVGAKSQ